jgi:ribosome recycling factor
MNYVEDMTNTLRRIAISIPPMTTEERKRLGDSLRDIQKAIDAALVDLDKAGQ